MSKGFALTFLIGILVIGTAVWTVFYRQKGAHIDPKGSILKVRTLKLDDNSTAVLADIRLTNDADYPLVARDIQMSVRTGRGDEAGNMIAAVDVKDLFKNFPLLGEAYNPVLVARDKVPPHGSIDREVCAQFNLPLQEVDGRKNLTVQVEDITGPTAVLNEHP